jgi:DNA-binding transcriptional MocR family regulator
MISISIEETPFAVFKIFKSQQGISFTAMLFLDKGDTLITEYPSNLGALTSFALYECNVKEGIIKSGELFRYECK